MLDDQPHRKLEQQPSDPGPVIPSRNDDQIGPKTLDVTETSLAGIEPHQRRDRGRNTKPATNQ